MQKVKTKELLQRAEDLKMLAATHIGDEKVYYVNLGESLTHYLLVISERNGSYSNTLLTLHDYEKKDVSHKDLPEEIANLVLEKAIELNST